MADRAAEVDSAQMPLRRRSSSRPGERAQSAQEDAEGDQKRHKIEVDDATLAEVVEHAKKSRGPVVAPEEKLDILLLQAKFRNEHCALSREPRMERKMKNAKATERAPKLLSRKKELVGQVWSDYCSGRRLAAKRVAGNRSKKQTRVPDAKVVASAAQWHARGRREVKARATAKDAMIHLKEQGHLRFDEESKKAARSALRSAQRFLTRNGHKRERKKGMMRYRLWEKNACKRGEHAAKLSDINKEGLRQAANMGESYMRKNRRRRDDSLCDPSDEQGLEVKAGRKGQRCCFIAAIVDCDRSVREEERADDQEAHLMLDALDIFQGGKSQTKDYHGMFDAKYFVEWMKALLVALRRRGIKNALIVMGNTKHRKMLPEGAPKGKWRKDKMQEARAQYGMPWTHEDLKSTLWSKLQKCIKEKVDPIVCSVAKQEGHEVAYSPPRYSDLQPIETVWAIVKGEVGRQCAIHTTFKEVLQRLQTAFHNLTPPSVQGCVNKANENLALLLKHILTIESEDMGRVITNASGEESSENDSSSLSGSSDDSL